MDYGQYLATHGEGIVHATNKKIFSLSFSKDFSLSLSLFATRCIYAGTELRLGIRDDFAVHCEVTLTSS